MKRPLSYFELVLVQELSPSLSDSSWENLAVIEEHFSKPRSDSKQWFNTDFMIQFVSPLPNDFRSEATPIRRHSIGVEVFAVFDMLGQPIRVELLGGEGFPKSEYKNEISEISRVVSLSIGDEWQSDVSEAPHLRVFDMDPCIIFTASTTIDLPSLAGNESKIFRDKDHEIHLRGSAGEQRLIEGVIRR